MFMKWTHNWKDICICIFDIWNKFQNFDKFLQWRWAVEIAGEINFASCRCNELKSSSAHFLTTAHLLNANLASVYEFHLKHFRKQNILWKVISYSEFRRIACFLHGIRMFITMFTKACQRILPWARWIQFVSSIPISLRPLKCYYPT